MTTEITYSDEIIVSHDPTGGKCLPHEDDVAAWEFIDWLEMVRGRPNLRRVFALPAGTDYDADSGYSWIAEVGRVVWR